MKTNYFQVKFPSLPENISLSRVIVASFAAQLDFTRTNWKRSGSRFLKLFPTVLFTDTRKTAKVKSAWNLRLTMEYLILWLLIMAAGSQIWTGQDSRIFHGSGTDGFRACFYGIIYG